MTLPRKLFYGLIERSSNTMVTDPSSHGSSPSRAGLPSMRYRRQNRQREVFLPSHTAEGVPQDQSTSFGPLWQFAKDRLSADSYAVLRLHYAEDLSIEEVAQVLGKGKIATKVMLHRARRKLSTFSDQLKDNYENPA